MRELIILGTASQVPTRTRTPNGRSSNFGRYRSAPTSFTGVPCYPRRDVVDAILYLDRTDCQWAALPADFPHPTLVYHYFKTWTADGTLTRIARQLREQVL